MTTHSAATPQHATTPPAPLLVLIPGHWLGAWAWDEVRAHLSASRIDAVALTLPGLDPADPLRADRTLSEQVAAIRTAIEAQGAAGRRPVTIAAHSGANAPVSLLLDQFPALVQRVIWVDSGPVGPGTVFAPDLPAGVAELPLPEFEALAAQASLAGLSDAALARFRERAVPQPGPVLRQPVELTNPARCAVPTTLVCCSIPSAQVLELARGGHPMFAEVAALTALRTVDLPTGHWPMWSAPGALAEILLAEIA
ncbi:alpha/beta fold hydrolase [Leucobacter chromiireducens]|uniref:alpha/beta fold hydrolase n=1 Tax=Leucobacter chromiireducens TaxID=283877 RepID=UPI000F63CE48|nr:alpha/beta fold hydrolase [Leucobacter chromiireducens]